MSTDLTDFFFNTRPSVVELETIILEHPNFSQQFRLVRNATNGITTVFAGLTYDYMPMQIRPLASSNDLDQEIEVTFGDLGDIIATEIENIADGNGFHVKPDCVYATFRSDDTSQRMFGPLFLSIDSVTLTKQGAAFRAKPVNFNVTKTGDIYELGRFPMLESVV